MIDIAHILSKIQLPENINSTDKEILQKTIEKYPYFQVVQAIYLKYLYTQDNYQFKKNLRTTSLHTSNRAILFDFLHQDIKNQENAASKIGLQKKTVELGITQEEANQINDPNLFSSKTKQVNLQNQKHNFNEWLNITKLAPINTLETKSITNNIKDLENNKLIDIFLKNKPKIIPNHKTITTRQITLKTEPSEQLMTETLANIYLEQKKYDKAIEAYKILILNNPKKSGFFADQIKLIKTLQDNN